MSKLTTRGRADAPTDGTDAPSSSGWALWLAPLLGWFFAGAGVMRLLPVPFDVALFASWGLPAWFRASVGVAELLVGVLTLRPATRQVGLIGIGVVMVSAATMHAALGHGLIAPVLVNAPLALAAFACAWATRFELLR